MDFFSEIPIHTNSLLVLRNREAMTSIHRKQRSSTFSDLTLTELEARIHVVPEVFITRRRSYNFTFVQGYQTTSVRDEEHEPAPGEVP